MWNPDLYLPTLLFAAEAHQHQTISGTNLNYVTHVANVAMEVAHALVVEPSSSIDTNLAIQCALLHDTIEDTPVVYEDILEQFGDEIAAGVWALTKDKTLPNKTAQMQDSLDKILKQGAAIRIVKMADRINNLQHPPHFWTTKKKKQYWEEAKVIYQTLKGVHPYIENRLAEKIKAYPQFF